MNKEAEVAKQPGQLPWVQGVVGNEFPSIRDATGVYLVYGVEEANAEFIVRAVNNHDEMLAALEAVVPRLCQACDLKLPLISTNTHQHPRGGILSCSAAEARAAIAKAKGGATDDHQD